MQIFIRQYNLNGAIITIECEKGDTIEDIKMKIYEKTGVPEHMLKLVHGSKLLDDPKTVDFYEIEKDDVLLYALSLRGK